MHHLIFSNYFPFLQKTKKKEKCEKNHKQKTPINIFFWKVWKINLISNKQFQNQKIKKMILIFQTLCSRGKNVFFFVWMFFFFQKKFNIDLN